MPIKTALTLGCFYLQPQVLAGSVTGPDASEGPEGAEENAPNAEPITMAYESAQPATKASHDDDTDANHKLHRSIITLAL